MISGGQNGAFVVMLAGLLLLILGLIFAPTGVGIAIALLGALLIALAVYTIFSNPSTTNNNCSFGTCYSNCLNTLLGQPLGWLLLALGLGGAYGAGNIPIMGAPALPVGGAFAGGFLAAYLGADAAAGVTIGMSIGAGLLLGLGYSAAAVGGWGIGSVAGCGISCGLNPCNY